MTASGSRAPADPAPWPSSPEAALWRRPSPPPRRCRGAKRASMMLGRRGARGARHGGGGGGTRGWRGSSACARAPRRRARGRPPRARPCSAAGPPRRRWTARRARGGSPRRAWTSRSRARAAYATWTAAPPPPPPPRAPARPRASASAPSPPPPPRASSSTWTPLPVPVPTILGRKRTRWIEDGTNTVCAIQGAGFVAGSGLGRKEAMLWEWGGERGGGRVGGVQLSVEKMEA